MSFFFLNRFLDIADAIEDPDNAAIDNTDFMETDIPSPYVPTSRGGVLLALASLLELRIWTSLSKLTFPTIRPGVSLRVWRCLVFKGRRDPRLGFGLVHGPKRAAEDGPAAMRQVLPPRLSGLHIRSPVRFSCFARCGAHIYTGAATCPPLSCTKTDKNCAVPVLHMLEASCNCARSARHCGTVSEPCACTSESG